MVSWNNLDQTAAFKKLAGFKDKVCVAEAMSGEEGAKRTLPQWLELNADELKGRVIALPKREDIDLTIEEHNIVEFYSR